MEMLIMRQVVQHIRQTDGDSYVDETSPNGSSWMLVPYDLMPPPAVMTIITSLHPSLYFLGCLKASEKHWMKSRGLDINPDNPF